MGNNEKEILINKVGMKWLPLRGIEIIKGKNNNLVKIELMITEDIIDGIPLTTVINSVP